MGGTQTLRQWLIVSKEHKSTLDRVMATAYSSAMYPTDRLFNRVAAIERYDKKVSGGEHGLLKRLKTCYDRAGSPMRVLAPGKTRWAKALHQARNDVAHHNSGVDDLTPFHLYLGESAYWLYVLCLLRDARAPDEVYERISADPRFVDLARRIREVL